MAQQTNRELEPASCPALEGSAVGLGLGFKRQELWSQNQTFLSSKLIGRRRHEAGGAQLLTENQEDSTVSTEEEARGLLTGMREGKSSVSQVSLWLDVFTYITRL